MKNYRIKVQHDTDAENPFLAWDGMLPLMYTYDGTLNDCSKGDITDFIEPTYEQVKEKKNELYKLLFDEEIDINDFEDDDDIVNTIEDELYNILYLKEGVDKIAKYLKIMDINHLFTSTTGCSQGDYSKVLIVPTDKFYKETGAEPITEERMEAAAKLFGYWAWGKTYGYTIEEKKEFKKVYPDGEEEQDHEWETVDSCYGFYGYDPKENGMIDNIDIDLPKDEILKLLEEAFQNIEY